MKRTITLICIFTTLTIFLGSCRDKREKVRGHGNSIEVVSNIDLTNISEVEIGGSIDVEIVPADFYEAVITAQENIIDLIMIKTIGNIVKIDYRPHVNVIPTDVTKITLYLPYVRSITTEGSGDAVCFSGFSTKNIMRLKTNGSGDIYLLGLECAELYLTTNGSGDIKAENINCIELIAQTRGSGDISVSHLSCSKVNSRIGGSGSIAYRGSSYIQSARIDGSGRIDAYNLYSEHTTVDVFGSGNSYLYVTDVLNVEINGSGNVYYKGNPRVYVISNGSGRVIPK